MKLAPTLLALAIAGLACASALAKDPPKGRTILVCHATHAKQRPYVPLRVPVTSVRARLKQGDVLPTNGRCPGPTPPAPRPATTTTSSTQETTTVSSS